MTHTTQHTEATAAPALLALGQQHTHHPGLTEGKGKPGVHTCLQFLRSIEDQMFVEAQEAFDVLKEEPCLRVDGCTYNQIRESKELTEELERIRANAPIYQNFTSRQKVNFFSKLGSDYKDNLKKDQLEREYLKTSDTTMQTSENAQIQNSSVEKSSKKIAKRIKTKSRFNTQQKHCRPLFQLEKDMEVSCTPKKVSFFHQSTVLYFAKGEASHSVEQERKYLFSTFDKF